MTKRTKAVAGISGGVLAIAAGAFFLLGNKPDDIPLIGGALEDEPATCPLTGLEPGDKEALERPAVAVKIENSSVAYPLSGLEDAEVVYEELVEGGVTRFMAIYHCTESSMAGPVRSARAVDPAILIPYTRILAYSGENAPVLEALEEAEIVRLDEDAANGGLVRIPRAGLSSEHTLYAKTAPLRRLGRKQYSEPPSEDLFEFGDLEGKTKRASSVSINFSGASTIRYDWSGDRWMRFQADQPFLSDTDEQIAVDNVLIEEHQVDLSDTIVDAAGNPSTEIANETGTGRAVLFRDGRAIVGTWTRDSIDSPVEFETKAGESMVFKPGTIWIHLVPSDTGEVTGSFEYAK